MTIKLTICGALVFLLAGCAWLQPKPPACEEVATASTRKITFRGLEIPIPVQGATDKFKIAGFEYDAKQTQVISDAVLALTDTRRRQCNAWWAMTRAKPPATAAQMLEMQRLFDASKQSENDLIAALVAGDQRRATQAAENMQRTNREIDDANSRRAALEMPLPREVVDRITRLEDGLLRLQARVDEMPRSGQPQVADHPQDRVSRSLSITGYPRAAVALSSPMKAKLEAEYQALLADFRGAPVRSVLVVGFADSSGAYLQNVEMGRRRAAAVAEFLQRRFPATAQTHVVTSGGIADGPDARRVEVLAI